MANRRFTARLNDAVVQMIADANLQGFQPDSRSLFTPIYRSGRFVWVKIMDSDGVILSRRKIYHCDEGGIIKPETELVIGVIIQSEDSTSQTKPNPIGKAAISHIPNGVWVTVKGQRLRVDKLVVAFVLPKGAAPEHQKRFATARRNVLNASDMMPAPDTVTIEVPRGISGTDLADKLTKKFRSVLVGRGRPRITAEIAHKQELP